MSKIDITISNFIKKLEDKEIKIEIHHDNLKIISTKNCLEEIDKNYIKSYKEDIIRFLKSRKITSNTTNIVTIFPLSPLQKGMLFHYLQNPKSDQYMIQFGIKITGKLNVDLFRKAWDIIISERDIFQARFVWSNVQHPVHIIQQEISLNWNYYDWNKLNKNNYKVALLLEEDRKNGFDLSKPCVMRFNIIKINHNEHLFFWTKHHVIIDGWSVSIIFSDLFNIYKKLLFNQLNKSIRPSFQSYINWIEHVKPDPAVQFWKDYLKDFNNVTTINGSLVPKNEYNQVIKHNYIYPINQSDSIRNFIRRNQITLNVLFMFAWGKLLSIYSNNDDVVFGSVFSGRSYPIKDINKIVGILINTLPIRIKLTTDSKISTFLKELNILINKIDEVSFLSLIEIKKLTNIPPDVPLFNTLYSFENYYINQKIDELDISIQVETYYYESKTHFPLQIQISPYDEIKISISADSNIYTNPFIKEFLENYLNIINYIIVNDNSTSQSIPIICQDQYNKIVDKKNISLQNHCVTVHDLFLKQVNLRPKKVALSYSGKTINYRQLNNYSNYLAILIRSNYKNKNFKEEFIAICLDRTMDSAISILSIWKLGAAYLPIDPLTPIDRIQYMLQDAKVKIIIAHKNHSQLFKTNIVSNNQKVIYIDDINFVDSETEEINTPSSIAYLVYTSGSTGFPKGVICYHHSVVNRFKWYWNQYPFEENEYTCQKAALTFVDSIQELFCSLLTGTPVEIIPSSIIFQPIEFIEYISKKNISRIELVPTFLKLLLDSGKANQQKLPILKWWITSGEELTPGLIIQFREYFPQAILLNRFGSTEASTTLWYDTRHWKNEGKVPIGKPIANTKIYITNEQLQLIPKSLIGELCISGSGIAQGYLNQPDLNSSRFINNPFDSGILFRSGDLVRYNINGDLEYFGRKDLQIKRNGIRIELNEIENIIKNMRIVKSVVVLSKKNENHLIAFIVFKEYKKIYLEEIIQYCKANLPHYMIPNIFIPLEKIPVTLHGKIDIQYLLNLPTEDFIIRNQPIPPKTELERIIIDCCKEVLMLNEISMNDNFLFIGGDSISAIKLIAKLQSILGITCSITTLLESVNFKVFSKKINSILNNVNLEIKKTTYKCKKSNLPLSHAQKRIWFVEQLQEKQNSLFNISHALKITGNINITLLEKSITTIISRHESLRMAFHSKMGDPYITVLPKKKYVLPIQHIKSEDINTVILNEINKLFDLKLGYLFRFNLIKIDNNHWIFLTVIHHIISDGWSSNVLFHELLTVYVSLLKNEKPQLPELTLRYFDFVTWQNSYLNSNLIDTSLNYWKNKLDNYQNLTLYLNRYSSFHNNIGKKYYFEINDEDYFALKTLAKKSYCTVYMVLLAIIHVVLSYLSKQNDLVIGSPIINRHHLELEGMIGLFINMLPMRNQVDRNQTLLQFLYQVKKTCLEAFQHQMIPFDKIVENIVFDRDLNQNQIFQVIFVLHSAYSKNEVVLNDAIIEQYDLPEYPIKYDLVFNFDDSNNQLKGFIHYKMNHFELSEIKNIFDFFMLTLKVITKNTNTLIKDINYLTEYDKAQIDKFNNINYNYIINNTIIDEINNSFLCFNKNTSIIIDEKKYSYSDLYSSALHLTSILQKFYLIHPNTLVGICLPTGYELIVSIFSILFAGGAYVPIDPTYPEIRKNNIISNSKLNLIIDLKKYNELMSESVELKKIKIPSKDDIAYVLYTSGSTGVPKGVMITHKSLLNYIKWFKSYSLISSKTIVDCSSSFSFDFTISTSVAPLLSGSTIVLCNNDIKNNISYYLDHIIKNSINLIKLTPSYFSALCNYVKRNSIELTKLETIILGGESINYNDCKYWLTQYPHHNIINEYGPTEATVGVCHYRISLYNIDAYHGIIPIGYPAFNTKIHILDDDLQKMPIGIAGDIYIEGDHLAKGYLYDDKETDTYFITDKNDQGVSRRLYRTNDVGRWLKNGTIEYIHRKKEYIKLLGYRINLNEITTTLKTHDDIKDAIAILSDENSIILYYVLNEFLLDVSEIQFFLKERLPYYMIPYHYIKLDNIPLNENGKLALNQLPKPIHLLSSQFVFPRTETEMQMLSIWSSLLKGKKISVKDNFFEIGGHSLLAIQLVSKVNDFFNLNLKVTDLFRYSTIETLCAILNEKTIYQTRIVLMTGMISSQSNVFIIPGSAGNPYSYLPLANYINPKNAVYGLKNPNPPESNSFLSIEEIAAYHIEGILSKQSFGPFHLIGHSFGALIAYQIACQLEEEGHEIKNLILLDTLAPRYLTIDGDKRDSVDWLLGIARVLAKYTKLPISLCESTLRKLTVEERDAYYLRQLVKAGIIPPTQNTSMIKVMIDVHRAASLASKQFIPLPYQGQVTLIKAIESENHDLHSIPEDWGWNELCQNKTHSVMTDGDHITMITEPHVKKLSDLINPLLFQ